MVKCPSCGKIVQEGKFCEKCGSSLEGATQVTEEELNAKKTSSDVGGAVGGFFNNIKSGMNKAATDLLAIKSNYSNATVICVISKIPNVQEKKIVVENDEVVYYNNGNGYEMKTDTFTTQEKDFKCCYIEKTGIIQNNVNIDIMSLIKNLNDTDKIKVGISYNLSFNIDDYDKLFHELINIKQDSWKVIDINSLVSNNIKKIISDKIIELLSKDGNLDLRDVKKQLCTFTKEIESLITNEVSRYGLTINMFDISNVTTDMYEINKMLISNLYK